MLPTIDEVIAHGEGQRGVHILRSGRGCGLSAGVIQVIGQGLFESRDGAEVVIADGLSRQGLIVMGLLVHADSMILICVNPPKPMLACLICSPTSTPPPIGSPLALLLPAD